MTRSATQPLMPLVYFVPAKSGLGKPPMYKPSYSGREVKAVIISTDCLVIAGPLSTMRRPELPSLAKIKKLLTFFNTINDKLSDTFRNKCRYLYSKCSQFNNTCVVYTGRSLKKLGYN